MKIFAFYTEECWIGGIRTSLVNAIFFKLADELIHDLHAHFSFPLEEIADIYSTYTRDNSKPVTSTRS